MPPPKKPSAKKAAKKPAAKPAAGKTKESKVEKPKKGRAAGDINWPVDADGQPMAKITFSCSDKIPTGSYANVTIGPATVSRFIPDDDDAITEGLTNAAELVERVVGAERVNVLAAIQQESSD